MPACWQACADGGLACLGPAILAPLHGVSGGVSCGFHATVDGFQQVSQEARGSSKSSVWERGFHCRVSQSELGGGRDDTPPSLARKVCGLGVRVMANHGTLTHAVTCGHHLHRQLCRLISQLPHWEGPTHSPRHYKCGVRELSVLFLSISLSTAKASVLPGVVLREALNTCAPQREAQAFSRPCSSPGTSSLAPSQSFSRWPPFGKGSLAQLTNAWVCFPDFFEPIFIKE